MLEQLVLKYQKTQDPEVFRQIYNQVKDTVSYHVQRYAASGIDKDLLELEARKLTQMAALSYKPSKGSFKTYLSSYLQKLYRFVNTYQHPLRLPENYKLNYQRYEEAAQTFRSQFGREPSVKELTQITGLPEHQIRTFKRRAIEASGTEDWGVFATSKLRQKEVIEDIKAMYGPQAAKVVEKAFETGKLPTNPREREWVVKAFKML